MYYLRKHSLESLWKVEAFGASKVPYHIHHLGIVPQISKEPRVSKENLWITVIVHLQGLGCVSGLHRQDRLRWAIQSSWGHPRKRVHGH